jgi:Protein of unknown function with HXXEE motif
MNRLHVATAGLFAAWLAHDLEELATMSGNSRALVRRLPDWVPLPASVRQRGLTQRYLATGVSAVGLVVAAASVRGYRTRGRSVFYQNTVLAFGLHGLGHIGISLLARGYTSGVATAPTVVVPFWLWATQALQRAGVSDRRSLQAAIALFAGSLAGGHLVAYLVTKNQPSTQGRHRMITTCTSASWTRRPPRSER